MDIFENLLDEFVLRVQIDSERIWHLTVPGLCLELRVVFHTTAPLRLTNCTGKFILAEILSVDCEVSDRLQLVQSALEYFSQQVFVFLCQFNSSLVIFLDEFVDSV